MMKYIPVILLTCSGVLAQLVTKVSLMPDQPIPYEMRDWKKVACGYDSLVFDLNLNGEYLPLIQLYHNTVNYSDHASFGLQTVVGSAFPQSSEAINCIPAVIGATLVGIDKSNQNGHNWVLGCEEFFNKRTGENIYLNHPLSASGDDWWYETMPNLFFYQLYDLYPAIGDFEQQFTLVADQWTGAIAGLGGATTPWNLPDMNIRAWSFSEMKPLTSGVPEPEAAGAIAWMLYHAWTKTGNKSYRIAAEQAMEFLDNRSENPSYELQLAYGVYIAARMNAELYSNYDLEKMVNWCFDKGLLRNWGVILGNWGGYDVHGLVGEISANRYAFLMNGFQQAAALVPMVRYDERFAADIAKWILNLANASRLFYSNALPANKQDSDEWAFQYDPNACIGYEALRQNQWGTSPYATGDAISEGWGKTNLALYGSSHVGYLAAMLDTTNVEKILKINVCKTDFFQRSFPTWLLFNPYDLSHKVDLFLEGASDGWEMISNGYLFKGARKKTTLTLLPKQALLLAIVPSGNEPSYVYDQMHVNNIIVDYHCNIFEGNYPPRIKSLAAQKSEITAGNSVYLYCTAVDPEGAALSYHWMDNDNQVIAQGPMIEYTVPDFPNAITMTCRVEDSAGKSVCDSLSLRIISNQAPVIQEIEINKAEIEPGDSLLLHCLATDAEMDSLSYCWHNSSGELLGSGKRLIWLAPDSPGYYELSCVVADSFAADTAFTALFVGSLVAAYDFNGNALDASGYGNNGMIRGATAVPDRYGRVDAALRFDKAGDVVQIPNHPSLNFRRHVSISLWVRMEKIDGEAYILSHGSWQNRFKLSVLPDRRLRWTVKTGEGVMDLDSYRALQIDSLYHICVTYGHGHASVYLNGKPDHSRNWNGLLETSSIDLVIGQMLPANNAYGFFGVIDDVKLFNAFLRENEVAFLYNCETGIRKNSDVLPRSTRLYTPYPNPFNHSTTIGYELATGSSVEITIYNLLGQNIHTLFSGSQKQGRYRLMWRGCDALGRPCPSGLYMLALRHGKMVQTVKTCILR